MKITIHVTPDDIANGKPQEGDACPIWHAVRREIPYLVDPEVDREGIEAATSAYSNVRIDLPPVACAFVDAFDDLEDVEPFEFELDVPDELAPAGAS